MKILRKIKISDFAIVDFSDIEKEIVNICNNKLRYLSTYVYNDKTVYINPCCEFIFEANHYYKKIYVNRDVWNVIEKNVGYDNTQKILSYFIKNKYEHYYSFYVMPKY